MNREQAIALGAADGQEDVETVLAEQGRDVVIATLKPGHLGWDEGARNAGVAQMQKVPSQHEEAYYEAYAEAGRARAEMVAFDAASADVDDYVYRWTKSDRNSTKSGEPDDREMAEIDRALASRGLTTETDDMGIRVVRREI